MMRDQAGDNQDNQRSVPGPGEAQVTPAGDRVAGGPAATPDAARASGVQGPGGAQDPLAGWTLFQVHREAERRHPSDPARANFGTMTTPVTTASLAMAVAIEDPPWVTLGIGVVCLFLFLLTKVLSLLEPIHGYPALILLGANDAEMVMHGQYFRILTSTFLHSGLGHLVFNLFGLWVLGRVCEPLLGPVRFLLVFLSTAMVGGLASALLRGSGVAVGASGGILGLLGTLIVFTHRAGRVLPDTMRKQLVWTFVPWLLFNLYMTLVQPSVDVAAHLAGVASGAAIGLGIGSPTVDPWAIRPGRLSLAAGLVGAVSAWALVSYLHWLVTTLVG